MQFGFHVPISGALSSPDNLVALARRGEELGYDYVCVGDHVVVASEVRSRYPYERSGEFPHVGDYLEQLTQLSFLASQTTTIRLLPSVMVAPYRPAVLTAKVLATIDVLSKGRLVVGCGVGWMREEFEALDAPPFEERGAVTDEYIRAFKELWTSSSPTFEGKYVRFSNVAFEPRPVQRPHPPIWIGGESPAALRRAARLGDGWYPTAFSSDYTIETPEEMAAYVARLRGYAEEADRDPSAIQIAYLPGAYDGRQGQLAPDGERRPFTGTPQQVADDIRGFGEVGVGHMLFTFPGTTLNAMTEGMERFATEVRPLTEG